MKPTLKAPGIERLKLRCDEPLSKFAFKLNLRHYDKRDALRVLAMHRQAGGRGLHSFTFRLNVNTFREIRLMHAFPPVY
jgi:hypothetical protein